MNLKIVDNFYKEEDFKFVITCSILNMYSKTWQPNNLAVLNKNNSYQCHETKVFEENDLISKIFINTFQEKTKLSIDFILTFFRKIYSSDLKNIFKYGMPAHKDPIKFDIAGIIHLNTSSLDDGTAIFSDMEKNSFQIEPDILIGAKLNRCVFYDSQIYHKPLQDQNTEMRIVQPFFIKLK
jgi:hypothetical protein